MLRILARVTALNGILFIFSCSCYYALAQTADDAAISNYSEEGQKALASGQYDAAEKNFVSLRALEPRIAEVHATLGLIYFQEKKFDQAVTEIRQAQKLKPALTKLDSLLAMSLSELGSYKEAIPGLEKAFRQSADPAVKRMCGLQLMRSYTGLQSDRKAVDTALELDKLYPNDPEILYYTSKVYGNYAFLAVSKLAQKAPGSVWRHLAAAEAYESQGSFNEALGEYGTVLSIEPHRSGVHYRMGRTLMAQYHHAGAVENLNEARKEYEEELQIDPRNGNASYELAEMHRQAGELDLAEQYFQTTLQTYPDFEEAKVGLAAVFMAEKKPEQALHQLQTAIALNPDNEVSWYRLTQVERALGNRTEEQNALAHFHKLHQAAVDQRTSSLVNSTSDITKQEVGSDAKE